MNHSSDNWNSPELLQALIFLSVSFYSSITSHPGFCPKLGALINSW
jgi:hypothetical protein